jgi:glycosyltransferase involved in cell wall biosynthesis
MKLLAVIEASSVTGPAKNLIDFARLARELPSEERIETSVATFERESAEHRSSTPNAFLEALREAGIPAFSIVQRSVTDRRAISGLREAVQRFTPDIVQTHAVKGHFLMRLSGLNAQRPWIAFHHGYTFPNLKMRAYNQLDRWSLRGAARILTVSLAFERQLRRQGIPPQRISVLHNAIDPQWMDGLPDASGLRAGLGLAVGERVVLTVGRLSQEKAHVDLVLAMKRLRELSPQTPARLIIVGDGPERDRIQQAARVCGLAESVTLAGFVRDPRPYYAIADVVVLSSLTEGSPNALLEAMAARVPVVATAVGGIPEIVQDLESALLVPSRQPHALAAALASIFADPASASRRAAAARVLIETRHSPQARVTQLVKIYRESIENANENANENAHRH